MTTTQITPKYSDDLFNERHGCHDKTIVTEVMRCVCGTEHVWFLIDYMQNTVKNLTMRLFQAYVYHIYSYNVLSYEFYEIYFTFGNLFIICLIMIISVNVVNKVLKKMC